MDGTDFSRGPPVSLVAAWPPQFVHRPQPANAIHGRPKADSEWMWSRKVTWTGLRRPPGEQGDLVVRRQFSHFRC
ncbi:hypothetical protein Mp_5g17990 [Marchantia polymorpha subsp. ruderalis]|uniref:Uncharacterized protein n=2 Tax=Marchantia polymorpha TaxID=3197 RepID=A0AAF6BJJ0_MARPO|nr:hypothetical protein MARPO_0084s0046 [Marchantia polymorpha]BBN12174.1 hypothetical protein Mp_5g17990 [Marchantia polymorpha subsp. ruderalis]|eukprot:PTQ33960.1 hypothetical protein MARPO_0084s0046 [Marchantia polymorpha]